MIISHTHKFIFVKTRKTAGTSIEIALSSICGDNDVITPINEEDELLRKEIAHRSLQNTAIPFSYYGFKDWLRMLKRGKRLRFYNHMPASEIKKYVDPKVWNSYYKFCFDRNPLTKSISHFKWRGEKTEYSDFGAYLNSSDVARIMGDTFYKDADGNYLIDQVYKMEEMETSFIDISEKINLKNGELVPPSFNTKKSKSNSSLSAVDIEQEFGDRLKRIFKTEYKDLYHL